LAATDYNMITGWEQLWHSGWKHRTWTCSMCTPQPHNMEMPQLWGDETVGLCIWIAVQSSVNCY